MGESLAPVYQFGPYRYDSAQRLLFRSGELIPLQPKAIDTLQALLERRGQVVDRSELMKLVWPDCVVEEVGLARNISQLRKALGDDAESYIETIPKRGYRFTPEAEATETHKPAPSSPPVKHRRAVWLVIAVLLLALAGVVYWQFYDPSRFVPQRGNAATLAVIPVECLSADLKQDAFSQSFAEALAEELSKLNSVQVISPSTVQRYRLLRIPTALMARILGLHVVVEGAAQRSGRQLRISMRLTDVHSGRLIWADRYDVAGENLQVQAQVARSVAEAVKQRLKR